MATQLPEYDSKLFPIADLLRDPELQVRGKLDRGTVQRYAQNYNSGITMPPVRVALVDCVHLVVDGWHRIAALETLGRETVEAVVVTVTAQEARWMAAEANLTHGLPLKRSELRAVFHALINARKHIKGHGHTKGRVHSYRELSAILGGVSHNTVRNWMRKDFPRIAQQYAANDAVGGRPELPRVPLKDNFSGTATRLLREALVASRGVTSATQRGKLLALADQVAAKIRAGGPWEPPPLTNDDF